MADESFLRALISGRARASRKKLFHPVVKTKRPLEGVGVGLLVVVTSSAVLGCFGGALAEV